ncbi:hypothetical protein DB41_DM00050 [Neochlamydia sp. TUME1]|uniref:hypothetical protein n=1 Tax=Neochlamydia sp. TUME1 TaxID=1478174 RepID=UPI00057C5117|nr:hypothetical protein [Neochlamydia sp. TUME1]KIC77020.1 hypothetical protein DB41_DM00050 [Neochlamydia sp. TUME1]
MDYLQTLNKIEKQFNILGSLPVIGIYSGIVRFIAGNVQATAGAILAGAGYIGMVFDEKNKRKWKHMTNCGIHQFFHGILNIIRGYGETVLAGTAYGSFALLIYQLTSCEQFNPRFKYERYPNYFKCPLSMFN